MSSESSTHAPDPTLDIVPPAARVFDGPPVVVVDRVCKEYRAYRRRDDRIRQLFHVKPIYRLVHAIENVSVSIGKGECLGIIGHNGAGKSTLLRMLAGIVLPTSGTLAVKGKLAAILELGVTFDPEFTGRENALLGGIVAGHTRKTMEAIMPEIVEFAELGAAIDEPVRGYSSGMFQRLAFAVAVSVSADVLLLDELLAVGDERYRAKCIRRLHTLQQQGVTMIVSSHDLETVRMLCHRCLWIDKGVARMLGPTDEVTTAYHAHMGRQVEPSSSP